MNEHDILNPEWPEIPFKAKDGNRYTLRLFVSYSVGAYIIDNAEELSQVYSPGDSRPKLAKKSYDIMLAILSAMLRDDYDFMDVEWLRKNLDIGQHFYLLQKVTKPLFEYLNQMGFTETVLPEKEPENE